MFVADGHCFNHVIDIAGNDDADRHLAVVRAVGGIKSATAAIKPHFTLDDLA